MTLPPYASDRCPVCVQCGEMQCRCRIGERACPDRHRWVWCRVHGTQVILAPETRLHGGRFSVTEPICLCTEGTPVRVTPGCPPSDLAGAPMRHAAGAILGIVVLTLGLLGNAIRFRR